MRTSALFLLLCLIIASALSEPITSRARDRLDQRATKLPFRQTSDTFRRYQNALPIDRRMRLLRRGERTPFAAELSHFAEKLGDNRMGTKTAHALAQSRKSLETLSLPEEITERIQKCAMHSYLSKALLPGKAADVDQLLSQACKSGRNDLLDPLVWLGADPNTHDRYGRPPLYYAVRHKFVKTARALLYYGANAHWLAPRYTGIHSFLYYAVMHQDASMVKVLLDAGVDRFEESLLFYAVDNEDVETATVLLDVPQDSPTRWSQNILSMLLFKAINNQDLEVAKLLLRHHVDVNAYSVAGNTALIDAIRERDVDMVSLLLANGANVHSASLASLLPPIYLALFEPSGQVLHSLIAAKADLHWRDASGDSLLHHAVLQGAYNCLKVLLDAGARPDRHQAFSISLLHHAVRRRDTRIVTLLLSYDVEMREEVGQGGYLLLETIYHQDHQMADVLVDAGANVHFHRHDLPLTWHAVLHGRDRIVKALVRGGADPNYRGPHGWSLLCFALVQRHVPVVQALLEGGADPNWKNHADIPLLFLVLYQRDIEMTLLLIRHGADVNWSDPWSRSLVDHPHLTLPPLLKSYIARRQT